ncbi:MAG: hypothetical protein HY823_01770 [Acidobacteria bacterium]|nr:hypothetical protein [Acidobacteriota bacterium]
MEAAAEGLIRATLHDLANVLSGVQGILDLSPAERPLSDRDRRRLSAALSEGQTALVRARSLAMETLPSADSEPLETWKERLHTQLEPLRVMFRSTIQIDSSLPPETPVPGVLLRGWIHAMARLLLPYTADQGLTIGLGRDGGSFEVLLSACPTLPEALAPGGPGPRDLASRWAVRLGEALGIQVALEGDVLRAKLGRG